MIKYIWQSGQGTLMTQTNDLQLHLQGINTVQKKMTDKSSTYVLQAEQQVCPQVFEAQEEP